MEKRSRRKFNTGASRGLRKCLAVEYADNGFNVMLCARNTEQLRDVCRLINESGGNGEFVLCDVSVAEDMDRAIKYTFERFGRVNIAILNAGIGDRVSFSNFDRNAFERVMATNLVGAVAALISFTKMMKQQGSGTIVGISSLNDARPIPGNSSKAALSILLEAAAIELKPLGINVITVRPGFFKQT